MNFLIELVLRLVYIQSSIFNTDANDFRDKDTTARVA